MDSNSGLVSIIMAAFNAGGTIDQAINSVMNQTYEKWELIVVDDGSVDATVSIVKHYIEMDSRIHLVQNSRNSGVSISRKRGLEKASGEWIAVLDSDDAWTYDKLEKQILFSMDKNAKLVFTGSSFMNNNGNDLQWILHVPEKITYKKLLKQNVISNSSVLVRKELYKKYYVTNDKMHEDYAMWLKITKDGIVGYGIDEPLLIYRLTKSSKSGNKLKSAKMNWNTYRFVGIGVAQSVYYMCWYIANGLQKYKHLKID